MPNLPAVTPLNLPSTARVPASPPSTSTGVILSPLERADEAFAAGRYAEASKAYENYLQRQGGEKRDEAMFRLAMSYALVPNPDWGHVTAILKQLVSQFPQTPMKPSVLVILAMQSDLISMTADVQKKDQRIKQLTTELEKLKQIDADRRKKP